MTSAADDYVRLCEDSSRLPDVFDFISKAGSLSARQKLNILLVDQFHRWKQQQAIPVEHYAQRIPELSEVHLVSLLVEEYGQLEERGVAPPPLDFAKRYREFGSEAFGLLCEDLDVDWAASICDSENPAATGTESPRRFGRYEVVCSIGEGAFGEVFLGRDPSLDRSVAIKVPTRERIELGGGAEALLDEARTVAKIDHPNVVPVYDHGQTEEGDCFIVSRYIKGKDLRSELRKSMPYCDTARIIASLARALHAAHQRGVIHRDVKPANVILDERGQPHLLDFGLALQGNAKTVKGGMVGTPAYMSPEQANCQSHLVDGRADIYSLGVVLYEMLARRRPFQGKAMDEAQHHSDSIEVQPPRQFADSIPQELEVICLKALSHKISDRYSTARDMAEAIEEWINRSDSMGVPSLVPSDQASQSVDSWSRWQNYGRLPEGPSLAVLPFTSMDQSDNAISLAAGLTEEISTQLSKFKDLFILGRNASATANVGESKLTDLGRELDVQFLLLGSVRRSTDQLRVTAQLVESHSSLTLWSETFPGNLSAQDIFEIEDEIANKVTASLGLRDGVIAQSRLRSKGAHSEDIHAYDTVTRFYQYMADEEPLKIHPQIRRELESTVKLHPNFSSARAALSCVYLNGFYFNEVEDETRDDLIEMAGKMAYKAVAQAPDNSIALEMLFRYEYHCRNDQAFMEGVERAIQANPNDTNMLANAGLCVGFLGDLERSLLLVRKAIALNPNPPGWYYLPEYWRGLLSEEYETAFAFAKRYGDRSYWGPAIRTVCLGHLQRCEEARQEWGKVIAMNPNFMEDFAWEMQAWRVNDSLQQASLAGLAKAAILQRNEFSAYSEG